MLPFVSSRVFPSAAWEQYQPDHPVRTTPWGPMVHSAFPDEKEATLKPAWALSGVWG